MTVFNSERHIRLALKSLSEQTFFDFEIIVLEHGSTDNSLSILNSWNDERLKIEVLPVNIGRTSALNRCLDRSLGKYIAILDSDDIAHPERLRLQSNFLDVHQNVGVVGTWSSFIDDLGHRFYEHRPATTHEESIYEFINFVSKRIGSGNWWIR